MTALILAVAWAGHAGPPPRTLRLIPGTATAGQPTSIAVQFTAAGDENALGFSVTFDPTRLTFLSATPADTAGRLLLNTNQAASGKLGFALTKGTGRTYPVGTASPLNLDFRAGTVTGETAVAFGDTPAIRETVDAAARTLTTVYEAGTVDVAPLLAPALVMNPSDATVYAGTNVQFTALAGGSLPLRFQWTHNAVPIPGAVQVISQYADCPSPPTSVVSSWAAEGNAADGVGQNHGTLNGGAVFGEGRSGQAFVFDGIDDSVSVPDIAALSPHAGSSGEMTVEARVRLASHPTSGQNRLAVVAKGSPNNWEYALYIYSTGLAGFSLWTLPGNGYAEPVAGYVTLNQWHHIVGTVRKGAFVRLFLDGALVREVTQFSGATGDGTSPLYIGRRGDGEFLRGEVDEVAVYRRALCDSEVLALYGAGGIRHYQEPGTRLQLSTLTLTNVNNGNAGDYRVVVTNAGGSATSEVARLTVLPALTPPSIVRAPDAAVASAGETVTFTGQATGSEPLTYQWQREGTDLPGQINTSLVLTNLTTAQSGNYRFIARNPVGSATSAAAALAVSATPRAIRVGRVDTPAGNLVELPIELYALGDENSVGFSLAFDPAQLEYRGLRRATAAQGTVLNTNATGLAQGRLGIALSKPAGQRFTAGTSPILYLEFLAGHTPGTNPVLVVDGPAAREIADVRGRPRPAEFTSGHVNVLDTPPSILTQPVGAVARLFSTVTFQVAANGSEPMYYQWLFNGEPIPAATNPVLTLASVMPTNTGDYQVRVSNIVHTAVSTTARLEVRRVVRLGGTNVPTGSTIQIPLDLLTAGDENAAGFSVNYDPTRLVLEGARLNAGVSNVTLNLRTNTGHPGVLAAALALPPNTVFPAGTQALMSLQFRATDLPGNTRLAFADIPLARELVDRKAKPVATDFVDGEVITALVPPQIIRHPVPRDIQQGDPVVFGVAVYGSLPIAYQWLLNGAAIANATNTTYSIPAAATTQAGNYSVQLSNIAGSLFSSNALLTVTVPDTNGPALANPRFNSEPLVPGLVIANSGTLAIDATDPSGVSRVEFYLDDAQISADLDAAGGYTASLDLERFADGPHTVSFRAYDMRSNPARLDVPIVIALAPPPPPIIGAPASGTITSNFIATVRGSGPDKTSVVLYRNGVRTGVPALVDLHGIFEATLPLLEGTNVVEAAALNRAAESAKSAPIVIVRDTTTPQPPNGLQATARDGGRVLLQWLPAPNLPRGYHLYRADASFTNKTQATRITGTPLAATSLEDRPSGDGLYFYRLTSVSQAGVEGYLSTEVSAKADSVAPIANEIAYTPGDNYDPGTGRFGRGIVAVQVAMNEPLQAAPFLSLTPAGGMPIVIELTKNTDTLYRGNFVIGDTAPSGVAQAVLSARDKAGNRGSRILAGSRILIDTAGPDVTGLAIDPAPPLRNNATNTLLVTLRLTLGEALKSNTVPDLTFALSKTAPQPQPVTSISPGASATDWTVTLRLPANAGQDPESLEISYRGEDSIGNVSTRIQPPHQFQVYLGDLPPLASPVGLVARTGLAGAIHLDWQSVEGAADYALYRRPAGHAEFQAIGLTGATTKWTNTPPEDGIYDYAVASVRRVQDQEALSPLSNVATAEADRKAPGAPTGLAVQLAKNGAFLTWTAPAATTEPFTYSLYRQATGPISDLAALAPLIQRIPIAQVVDPNPTPDAPYYAVAAVDRAGNVSPPSNAAYLNADLFPVQSLAVGQTNNDPPVLTWTQVGRTVAGHDIFLGNDTNQARLNRRGMVTNDYYIDIGYTGDERRYTVYTVDRNLQRSDGRSILLPLVTATLEDGTVVKRGLMNRVVYTVRNDSRDAAANARLLVDLAGRRHASEPFWLPGQSVTNIPVVLGGYTDLPADQADLVTTVEINPEDGLTTRIVRSGTVATGDGQLLVSVLAADLIRGGTAKVRFSIFNPSAEEIEIVSANGSAPSPDVRFTLFDAEGQQLAAAPFYAPLGSTSSPSPTAPPCSVCPAGRTWSATKWTCPFRPPPPITSGSASRSTASSTTATATIAPKCAESKPARSSSSSPPPIPAASPP